MHDLDNKCFELRDLANIFVTLNPLLFSFSISCSLSCLLLFPDSFPSLHIHDVFSHHFLTLLLKGFKAQSAPMFIAAHFVESVSWKHPVCPSTDERVNNVIAIPVLHLREDTLESFVGKCMQFEAIMLSKINTQC